MKGQSVGQLEQTQSPRPTALARSDQHKKNSAALVRSEQHTELNSSGQNSAAQSSELVRSVTLVTQRSKLSNTDPTHTELSSTDL